MLCFLTVVYLAWHVVALTQNQQNGTSNFFFFTDTEFLAIGFEKAFEICKHENSNAQLATLNLETKQNDVDSYLQQNLNNLSDVKLYIGAKRNPENGSFYWVNSNTEYLEEVNQSQPLFQFLNTGTENNDNSSCLAVFFQSSMMVERVNCAANYSALCEISKDNVGCEVRFPPCPQLCEETDGHPNCVCQSGYVDVNGNGTICTDIDECDINLNLSNCSHECVNTDGSYTCKCNPGFEDRETAGRNCKDIDECELSSTCPQICMNTNGSYICQCNPGFDDVNNNGLMCPDIDECAQNLTLCPHDCINTNGSYKCACGAGYIDVNNDAEFCTDIDECDTNLNLSNCSHECVNTDGSYTCKCNPGYEDLETAGENCKDFDECTLQSICPHLCNNIEGSYFCQCFAGFFDENDDGSTCTAFNDRSTIIYIAFIPMFVTFVLLLVGMACCCTKKKNDRASSFDISYSQGTRHAIQQQRFSAYIQKYMAYLKARARQKVHGKWNGEDFDTSDTINGSDVFPYPSTHENRSKNFNQNKTIVSNKRTLQQNEAKRSYE